MRRSIELMRGAPSATGATLCASLCVACAGGGPGPDREMILASLVAAERSFAAAAAEHGVKEAFLANMADDAVLFRPGPVPAKDHLRGRPGAPGLLVWEPEYADAAADGSLGYTTGPWTFQEEPTGAVRASGRYLTFWRALPGGGWEAVIDHGIAGPVAGGTVTTGSHVATPMPDGTPPAIEPAVARSAVLAADSALGAKFNGVTPPDVSTLTAPDVRVLRQGSEPLSGPEALLLGLPPGVFKFEPVDAQVAASADLAFTHGEFAIVPDDSIGSRDSRAGASIERGTYLRGWRRDVNGRWRLVIDLMAPLPAAG